MREQFGDEKFEYSLALEKAEHGAKVLKAMEQVLKRLNEEFKEVLIRFRNSNKDKEARQEMRIQISSLITEIKEVTDNVKLLEVEIKWLTSQHKTGRELLLRMPPANEEEI